MVEPRHCTKCGGETEVRDRVRRIETRLTAFLVGHGFDAPISKPVWDGEGIKVPSPACTLKDIKEAIPKGWQEEVVVTCNGEFVMAVFVTEEG